MPGSSISLRREYAEPKAGVSKFADAICRSMQNEIGRSDGRQMPRPGWEFRWVYASEKGTPAEIEHAFAAME
jgi:hypothetical protein